MYKLEYLPSANIDIMEAEAYLYEFSQTAADKFSEAIDRQMALLISRPFMYPVYKDRKYFRCILLPYKYLCFYHADETAQAVTIHRVIRGMRDIQNILFK